MEQLFVEGDRCSNAFIRSAKELHSTNKAKDKPCGGWRQRKAKRMDEEENEF